MRDFEDATKKFRELAFGTVILPAGLGGLLEGIPDPSVEALREPVLDVVDDDKWRRVVLHRSTTGIDVALLLHDGRSESLGSCSNEEEARAMVIRHLHGTKSKAIIRFEAIIGDLSMPADDLSGDDAVAVPLKKAIAYFQVAAGESLGNNEDARSLAAKQVTLTEHTRVVEAVARDLGRQLGLPLDLCEAVALAARWHDCGKNRPWWQAAVGNTQREALAKSGEGYFDHAINKGYRHEFGSLVEARDSTELSGHPNRELILHLIAAHHGHARPSFAPHAFDRRLPSSAAAIIAAEVPIRFVALQQRYGWWTLAWLEALVKCADAIASANPDWPAS
jgi:CRISPR-associated endonuclease/helicase Cas3